MTALLLSQEQVCAVGLQTDADGQVRQALQLGGEHRAQQVDNREGDVVSVEHRHAASGTLSNAAPRRRRLFGRTEPRPVPWGSAIGHKDGLRGTLACRVRDPEGQEFAMSAAHVLTNVGEGAAGDDILQPPPQDLGRVGKHTIAQLTRWVPFHVNEPGQPVQVTEVDAAIAKLDGAVVSTELKHIPVKGRVVRLSGASTKRREGTVEAIGATVRLVHPISPEKYVVLSHQVLTTPMGCGGDSGSLVVTPVDPSLPVEEPQDYLAVGLFAGGAPAAEGGWSVVGPLERALEKLGVELVT